MDLLYDQDRYEEISTVATASTIIFSMVVCILTAGIIIMAALHRVVLIRVLKENLKANHM